MLQNDSRRKRGQRIAILVAGTGLCWIALQVAGSAIGLSQKVMVLFDMLAGVGFVMALWMSYQLRRTPSDSPASGAPDTTTIGSKPATSGSARTDRTQRDHEHTDRK